MQRPYGNEVSEVMEDAEILALFNARSEDAIGQVREKYGRACMHLLRNLLCNEQDAEECANDTYLALWNTIPPEQPQPLLSYILRIARNLGLRRITYYNAQRRDAGNVIPLEELETCLASTSSVECELDRKLLEASLERFLRAQPKELRQLFLRRYWFCDSTAQLAADFGWSESRVKTRLFRLRSRLRAQLIKEGLLDETI